jgi:hypothetical protein
MHPPPLLELVYECINKLPNLIQFSQVGQGNGRGQDRTGQNYYTGLTWASQVTHRVSTTF